MENTHDLCGCGSGVADPSEDRPKAPNTRLRNKKGRRTRTSRLGREGTAHGQRRCKRCEANTKGAERAAVGQVNQPAQALHRLEGRVLRLNRGGHLPEGHRRSGLSGSKLRFCFFQLHCTYHTDIGVVATGVNGIHSSPMDGLGNTETPFHRKWM